MSVIASRQCYDDPEADLPGEEVVDSVRICRVESTRYGRYRAAGRLLDYVSFVRAARSRLKLLVDPETIVVAKTDPPMLGMFLEPVVRSKGGRLVNWLQDVFPETLTALSDKTMVRAAVAPLSYMRDRSLKKAVANVVIGEQMRRYLVTRGVPAANTKMIHNWPYESPASAVEGDGGRGTERDPDDPFVIGYFGNLGRVHEYETILGAMRGLASEARTRFLFVGGGYLLERLKARAGELELRNFEHRDYVPREDLPAALKVVDVHLVVLNPALERFVVPSKFAGVVAAGRPVLYVGDPDGELGRTIGEHRCGYVVRPGDSEDLARRIRDLSGNPDTLQRMGASAARLYQAQYRRDMLLEQWRGLLTGLGANTA